MDVMAVRSQHGIIIDPSVKDGGFQIGVLKSSYVLFMGDTHNKRTFKKGKEERCTRQMVMEGNINMLTSKAV